MGIDAALGRIQQILTLQQQLFDPAATTTQGTAPGAAGTAAATGTGGGTFANALASAQASTTGGAPLNASGYVNPLANASVTPERIDQGVDYSGSGTLGAIGPGVVTQVVQTGSGWEGGGYVEYKLTAGPYAGKSVYYAEGVTPTVTVGETLAPGQAVATIIPGAPHGIELGFASGNGDQTSYATANGGGYSEGALTAAGVAFSNLVSSLGGPAGLTQGRAVTGSFQ
ncbi:MAG TPA: hypothetical protein VKU39_06670 [Streptosporangiaceae bacterium]|nr:hypothetical protein [Streptosporangiaceae bacterium]